MSTMNIAATLEDIPRPAWIALMVLAFFVFWPLGLAILAYLIWSRRMSCWGHHRGWQQGRRYAEAAQRWYGPRRGYSSGNRAFDDYREETLRRLEDEQKDFVEFLERLRFAKDRSEFDQFMAERRSRPQGPEPQPQA